MFSLAQKADIRLRLGWTGRYAQIHSELESAMQAVSAETETLIVAELANCATVDTGIAAVHSGKRLQALRVGELEIAGVVEIETLRGLGRQAVGRISAMLGIPINHDIYSPAGLRSPTGSYLMHG